MSTREIMDISFAMQKYHGIFKKLWEITRPIYTDNKHIPTAEVSTDLDGNFFKFMINKDFFSSLSKDEQYFIIVHEFLHLILGHPMRTVPLDNNGIISSIAVDLVVNNAAITRFGMHKNVIDPDNVYCWIENSFDLEIHPEINEFKSMEFYYYALLAHGNSNIGKLVSSHNFSKIDRKMLSDILKKISGELSDKENKILKSLMDGQKTNLKAGKEDGTEWFVFTPTTHRKTKKWESIIINWCARALSVKEKECVNWHTKPRRLFFIDDHLNIPTVTLENHKLNDRDKLNVFLFQDISGSCSNYADRFYNLSLTIPADKFNVHYYAFDTKVQEFSKDGMYIGGGTSFSIIETFIHDMMDSDNIKYPDAVFVLTDGAGDTIDPTIPSRYYWLLTDGSQLNYIPSESHTFDISEFE